MLARFKLKAKEGRMDNAEMMQMLRAEMAKSRGRRASRRLACRRDRPESSGRRRPQGEDDGGLDPADVISLDDDNFGKF